MKIHCPDCKCEDFDPDPSGDDQYYYCKKCKRECTIHIEGESFLTKTQLEFLMSQKPDE